MCKALHESHYYGLYMTSAFRDLDWEVSCYTFGSPRVGNTAFSAAFGQLVKTSWRVHTFTDVVPRLPPPWFVWRFQHVDALVCP